MKQAPGMQSSMADSDFELEDSHMSPKIPAFDSRQLQLQETALRSLETIDHTSVGGNQ